MKASVDIKTGKIYGCKEGSFEHWHERAHLLFQDKFNTLVLTQQRFHTAWQGTLTIALLLLFFSYTFSFVMVIIALMCFLIEIGIDFYEEVWCNNYAFDNWDCNSKVITKKTKDI